MKMGGKEVQERGKEVGGKEGKRGEGRGVGGKGVKMGGKEVQEKGREGRREGKGKQGRHKAKRACDVLFTRTVACLGRPRRTQIITFLARVYVAHPSVSITRLFDATVRERVSGLIRIDAKVQVIRGVCQSQLHEENKQTRINNILS